MLGLQLAPSAEPRFSERPYPGETCSPSRHLYPHVAKSSRVEIAAENPTAVTDAHYSLQPGVYSVTIPRPAPVTYHDAWDCRFDHDCDLSGAVGTRSHCCKVKASSSFPALLFEGRLDRCLCHRIQRASPFIFRASRAPMEEPILEVSPVSYTRSLSSGCARKAKAKSSSSSSSSRSSSSSSSMRRNSSKNNVKNNDNN